MPTPTHVFAALAAKYGGVDRDDMQAVRHWYQEVLPTLSPDLIEEILDELLKGEGRDGEGTGIMDYPADAPLPGLDEAPPVPPPLFAAGWREIFRRLLTRHGSDDSTDT